MRQLFIYKGLFKKNLAGPELRYIRTAEQLQALGHECLLATDHSVAASPYKNTVNIFSPLQLLKKLLWADCVYLHGGGPIILALSTLVAILGKRVYLDAYAPHWLECHSVRVTPNMRMFTKIIFNLLRVFYASLLFDGVIVGNRRQLDLYRGISLISANPFDMQRLKVIPFGCEPATGKSERNSLVSLASGQISEGDFLIGWLGGMWDWFDPAPLLKSLADISKKNSQVKMIFFGISQKKQKEMDKMYRTFGGVDGTLVFLSWVDYDKRLEVWSGLDLAVVWGKDDLENDYAMRTRNFDCISIALPIVQNWDDCWGPLIKDKECGVIVEQETLTEALLELAHSETKIARMSKNMAALEDEFAWEKIAGEFLSMNQLVRYGLLQKVLRFGIFLFAAPLMVLNFACSYFFGKNHS